MTGGSPVPRSGGRATRRLDRLPPETLTEEQRRVYERITGGPRGDGPRLFELTDDEGALLGPFNAMLLSPPVGDALQALGAALRYRTALSDRVREAVILVVATHCGSAFERYAHEAVGRHVGLTPAEIDGLRSVDPAEAFAEEGESVVVRFARQLLSRGNADDECFDELTRWHGIAAAFEIATLVGYYSTLATLLRLFEADTVPGGGAGRETGSV